MSMMFGRVTLISSNCSVLERNTWLVSRCMVGWIKSRCTTVDGAMNICTMVHGIMIESMIKIKAVQRIGGLTLK